MKTNFNTSIHTKKQLDKYANVPKEYMKIAEGMESQFNQHLLAQMKKTVDYANPGSPAQKLYEKLLDEHYAEIMASNQNGTGIKDVVLDQIYPQHKRPMKQVINQYNSVKGNTHERN